MDPARFQRQRETEEIAAILRVGVGSRSPKEFRFGLALAVTAALLYGPFSQGSLLLMGEGNPQHGWPDSENITYGICGDGHRELLIALRKILNRCSTIPFRSVS